MELPNTRETQTVEGYKFELIRGYPRLYWKGKRPFTSTQYYPAQLKEKYGEKINNWLNKIYWGDNLQVMSHLLKKFRGDVDLVYIDPPFDSKADYKRKIQLRGKAITNDRTAFEEKQYTDIWVSDEYLQYMYERLILIKELLSDEGSVFIHLGSQVSHYLRGICDEIFGENNFRNEIILPSRAVKNLQQQFGSISRLQVRHDVLLWYTKKESTRFKPFWVEKHNSGNPEGHWHHFWSTADRPTMRYELFGITPSSGQWVWKKERALQAFENYERYLKEGGGRTLAEYWRDTGKCLEFIKQSPDDGKPLYWREPADDRLADTMWSGVPIYSNNHNYPTEKNLSLLQQILNLASKPGDLVADFFCGSGTALEAAVLSGCRFIGTDINLGAVQTTTKRLLGVAAEIESQQQGNLLNVDDKELTAYYTGFEVYNVNHYDVFRNPVQAKELVQEALEVNPLEKNNLFDGEKDGRMVKLMPVNRIATRADLNELIAGFEYKTFEKRQAENPNKPVEKITLVCMGHEPDLKAILIEQVKPYSIDVEVVDILRDKSNLEFKRDSEAVITIRGQYLVIEKFYPMNLLQKLSLQQENVEDWRELVESVMIDWNYDGAILEPKLVDIPNKNELVKGRYKILDDAGTIRVKITDLLSESLEVEVQHG
jgi:site-specific DNA-methyltransferase (adenine-specific)/adenine-specific DNA-methyltransferase